MGVLVAGVLFALCERNLTCCEDLFLICSACPGATCCLICTEIRVWVCFLGLLLRLIIKVTSDLDCAVHACAEIHFPARLQLSVC